jgi:DNA-binding transcriptional LysR family regulator
MHKIKWGDLQYILSVANEGSVAAAARALNVNHSTVLRRIDNFEHRHKVQLFHRLPTGYKFTSEGNELFSAALEMEKQVKVLERNISGKQMKLEGTLRITTTDTLFSYILSKHIASFAKTYPLIKLNLNITTRLIDVATLDADIAIRPTKNVHENLWGKRLCGLSMGVYGTAEYLSELKHKASMQQASWLSFDSEIRRAYLPKSVQEHNIVLEADSYQAIKQSAENGLGLAVLPCFMGDSSNHLLRIKTQEDMLESTSLWLITHKDIADSGRVKAFTDYMAHALKEEFGRLAGGSNIINQFWST